MTTVRDGAPDPQDDFVDQGGAEGFRGVSGPRDRIKRLKEMLA
jgi:hypothetical protein